MALFCGGWFPWLCCYLQNAISFVVTESLLVNSEWFCVNIVLYPSGKKFGDQSLKTITNFNSPFVYLSFPPEECLAAEG